MPALTAGEAAAFPGERDPLSRGATTDADGLPRVLPPWFIVHDGARCISPRHPAVLQFDVDRAARG